MRASNSFYYENIIIIVTAVTSYSVQRRKAPYVQYNIQSMRATLLYYNKGRRDANEPWTDRLSSYLSTVLYRVRRRVYIIRLI